MAHLLQFCCAPMAPNYISEKPGKSPMGMDLVPVYADEDESPSAHTIRIDPVTIQNMGIRTTVVTRGPLITHSPTHSRVPCCAGCRTVLAPAQCCRMKAREGGDSEGWPVQTGRAFAPAVPANFHPVACDEVHARCLTKANRNSPEENGERSAWHDQRIRFVHSPGVWPNGRNSSLLPMGPLHSQVRTSGGPWRSG